MFRQNSSGDRLKAATTCLVLHKSGDVEINCKSCGNGVVIPLKPIQGQLRKGSKNPKFVLRR